MNANYYPSDPPASVQEIYNRTTYDPSSVYTGYSSDYYN